jgi:mono/diheme cytochrome c family protein
MRRTRWIAAVFTLTILAIAAVAFAASTGKSAKSAGKGNSKVDRGRYLATVTGCNDCHTPGTMWGAPDMTRTLSGSDMAWVGPWGAVYAANLTPDPETGLGKWTDEQIIAAIRTGNRPDGRQLAPIMPYMNFAQLTDEDAQAIVAYLRSLPPVVHAEPTPLPPGTQVTGPSVMNIPPPSEWDAKNLPKAPGGGSH